MDSYKGHSRNQYYAAFCANFVTIAYATACAWASPSIPFLESSASPLASGPITKEDGSWINSVLSMGGILGTLVFGSIVERFGRKIALLIVALPQISAMILIINATNVSFLVASRLLSGIAAGGLFVAIPLYLVEIAETRNRGFLGTFMLLFSAFGFLLGYILGYYLSYFMLPWVLVAIPTSFLCVFVFFPESPTFLMKKQRISDAEKSLRFFRGFTSGQPASHELTVEFMKLKSDYSNEKTQDKNKLELKDFMTKSSRKAFLIAMVLVSVHEFCGVFAMLNYSATIFIEAGSTLSPDMSSIIIGVIQVFGSYISTALVERAGRKLLFAISSFGLSVALGSMALFAYFKHLNYDVSDLNWIPLASFSLTIFVANIGVLTLPYVIIAEILPVKIKDIALTIIMVISWSFSFVSVKTLSPLIIYFGMHGTFFLFSLVCLIGLVFLIVCVPETKGKSFDAILALLEK